MPTLFRDNAHIHYHPLMFVYLIWLDHNLHKRHIMHSSTLFIWGILKGCKQTENESQTAPCESFVTLAAIFPITVMLPGFPSHHHGSPLSYFTSCCHHSPHYTSNQTCTALPNVVNPIFFFFAHLFPNDCCCLSFISFLSPSLFIVFSSPLSAVSAVAALIKHGVGGGTESSSRAEEKGSNSSSQDETLTHNGPAISSAPP